MILWTIQKESVWKKLNKDGYLIGKRDCIFDDEWIDCYEWMMDQMKKRIGNPQIKNSFPIWAWYQFEGSKPDLRSSGHLPRKEKGVRIEFECHEDEVLLSDFELWHYVLNYWYLPSSIADDKRFENELEKKGLSFFETKPLPDLEYHQKIQKSWERIFDIDWDDPHFTHPKDKKSIQATLWQLKIDQVKDYTPFIAR